MTSHRPYADEGEVETTFRALRTQLDRIEAQVMKTNGRVQGLELWRAFMTGGLAVLTLISGAVVTLLLKGLER